MLMEELPSPYLFYLPFGWAVAAFAETARLTAVLNNGTQALAQLAVALTFIALEQK